MTNTSKIRTSFGIHDNSLKHHVMYTVQQRRNQKDNENVLPNAEKFYKIKIKIG